MASDRIAEAHQLRCEAALKDLLPGISYDRWCAVVDFVRAAVALSEAIQRCEADDLLDNRWAVSLARRELDRAARALGVIE